MKFKVLGLLLSIFLKIEVLSGKNQKSSLRKAFGIISKELAVKNSLVQVIVEDDFENETKTAILSTLDDIPHYIAGYQQYGKWFLPCRISVVLLRTVKSLKIFNYNMRRFMPRRLSLTKQIFYITNISHLEDLQTYYFQYFVIEDKKTIRLLTIEYYTPQKCNKPQLKEINRFDKSQGRWQHEVFSIEKFSAFHGCRINFLFDGGMPDFAPIEIDYKNKTITKCRGYTCAIIRDFSSHLNFTYHMNIWVEHNNPQMLFPDIPYGLFVETISLSFIQSDFVAFELRLFTRPIFYVEHFLTIPPGEEFNGYEKMILPYDDQTWMWIVITFSTDSQQFLS